MNQNFNEKLQGWINGVNQIVKEYHARLPYSQTEPELVTVQDGRRYIRVVQNRSAFAFIDKTNGDVLKAASWKAPAKHARGNIFDGSNGLKFMTAHGPMYLR